jgi:Mg/Co/Ni transporter MgtE
MERRREEASRMTGTLTKLEDKELSAVLEQLDLAVLETLYIEATGRNRTRLLQAMPAERAALVVRGLVSPADQAANDAPTTATNDVDLPTLNE